MNAQTNSNPSQPSPQVPATPSPSPVQPPVPGKKSNTALIIILVVVGILIIGGVGAYLAVKYAAKKVSNAVTNSSSNTSSGQTNTSASSTSAENPYLEAKDLIPTDAFTISINNIIKPILASMFGGVKLNVWAGSSGNNASMEYVTKNKVAITDYSALEAALVAKGFVKTSNANTADGFMFTGEGNGAVVVVQFSASLPYEIVVGADKSAGDE